jgi:hypothetical protein
MTTTNCNSELHFTALFIEVTKASGLIPSTEMGIGSFIFIPKGCEHNAKHLQNDLAVDKSLELYKIAQFIIFT